MRAIVVVFSLIVVTFSYLYWTSSGNPRDFGVLLSKRDAVYFTLGTMTSAGTGNIAPVGEHARTLVSIHMLIDFASMGVALSFVLAKLGEKRDASH